MTSHTMTLAKGNSRTRELGVSCGAAGHGQGWGVTPPSRSASDPCQGDSQSADLSCPREGSR